MWTTGAASGAAHEVEPVSLQQGWKLARLWYGDRLNPTWRPMTSDRAQSVFAEVGLLGHFWRLG
jgi:hypothetical protein